MFIKTVTGTTICLIVYVDDIVVTVSGSSVVVDVIFTMNKQFSLKYFGKQNYFWVWKLNMALLFKFSINKVYS